MLIQTKFLVFLFSTILFVSCEEKIYTSIDNQSIIFHTILDPEININIQFWLSQGINVNNEDYTNDSFEFQLYENSELINNDTISLSTYELNYKPIPDYFYQFKLRSIQHPNILYESLEYEIIKEPEISLIDFNDSLGRISEFSFQLHQKIDLGIDTSDVFYPYFAYQVTSDSSSFFGGDSDTIVQTNKWSIPFNQNCTEVAVPAFFNGDYKIINRSCQNNSGLLPFVASTSLANEFEYMDFEICMIDQVSIILLRQISQDQLYQSLGEEYIDQLSSLFITKDNFTGLLGYDFIVNRACSTIRVVF